MASLRMNVNNERESSKRFFRFFAVPLRHEPQVLRDIMLDDRPSSTPTPSWIAYQIQGDALIHAIAMLCILGLRSRVTCKGRDPRRSYPRKHWNVFHTILFVSNQKIHKSGWVLVSEAMQMHTRVTFVQQWRHALDFVPFFLKWIIYATLCCRYHAWGSGIEQVSGDEHRAGRSLMSHRPGSRCMYCSCY